MTDRVTKAGFILKIWQTLNSHSAGQRELEVIQKSLAQRFGAGGLDSPATIARTLADAGIPLRHPEILDFDTDWRDARSKDWSELDELDFSSIDRAIASVGIIERLWGRVEASNDAARLHQLRQRISEVRRELQILARSKTILENQRKVAQEAEHWLVVWLQNPAIFRQWLELRRNSPEFLEKFSGRQG